MKYTVYKTANLVNGKYYFGVHKTENPDDGYLGSGKYIKRAVAKYGVEKFRKDVLFVYPDPESAFAKEDELIQCFRGRDPLCKNLRKGGSGGLDWINREELNLKNNIVGRLAALRYLEEHPEKRHSDTKPMLTPEIKKKAAEGKRKVWLGKKHKQESKRLMSAAATNRLRGVRWITDGVTDRQIKCGVQPNLGWMFGRVTNKKNRPRCIICGKPRNRGDKKFCSVDCRIVALR